MALSRRELLVGAAIAAGVLYETSKGNINIPTVAPPSGKSPGAGPLTASVSGTATVGSPVQVTVTVSNLGTSPASVKVSGQLKGPAYTAALPAKSVTVPANGKKQVVLKTSAALPKTFSSSTVTANISVGGTSVATVTASAKLTVKAVPAKLSASVPDESFSVGQRAVFPVTIQNSGGTSATVSLTGGLHTSTNFSTTPVGHFNPATVTVPAGTKKTVNMTESNALVAQFGGKTLYAHFVGQYK